MNTFHQFVPDELLVKLCSRCNVACSYCYWFRDGAVYKTPAFLEPNTQELLVFRIGRYVRRFRPARYTVILHGGEPLLFPKRRFVRLCRALRDLEHQTGCHIVLKVQTNGVLVDNEWCAIFKGLRIRPSVSIDGPPDSSSQRVDFRGNDITPSAVRGFIRLKEAGLEPGMLSVYGSAVSAQDLTDFAFGELGARWLDVLFPDITHEDPIPDGIAQFYCELLDLFIDVYNNLGCEIRVVRNILNAVLGKTTPSANFGFTPLNTFAIGTNGDFETCDVFHAVPANLCSAGLNLKFDDLEEIANSLEWKRALSASLYPAHVCIRCKHLSACGGGFVPHRWSDANGFENASVYCTALTRIFAHAMQRLSGNKAPVETMAENA